MSVHCVTERIHPYSALAVQTESESAWQMYQYKNSSGPYLIECRVNGAYTRLPCIDIYTCHLKGLQW